MRHYFLAVILCATGVCASAQEWQIPVSEEHERMQTGAYEPTWESLQNYQVPEWFRNAKFGIWAHWGAQCVEGSGDWMARELYMEGNGKYNHHKEHYGHPSEFGYKDVLPLFKAERWDPKTLVNYYKEIGAEYFFVLGNHHDNYDLWDSKYQEWNSVNVGPKRDILAEWAEAAREAGLPLGISFHADHAWTWFEPSRRFDMKGEMRGKLYDGWLTKADGYKLNPDGTEKWWKGLDPQKLYAQDHDMSRDTWDNGAIHRQWGWGGGACLPSQEFVTNFYDRTLDAINRYNPDLIYFDVTVLPFYPVSDAGMKITAHMYNHHMDVTKDKPAKGDKNSAKATQNPGVVFGKILENDQQRSSLVWDVERGAPNQIVNDPWQCCNCIGDWHYNTGIYERGHYKSASTVAKLLVDIVSKNGNMLLNIPLRADGTYDEKEAAILAQFGAWMKVNKESIVGTRPWKIFGEGPIAESTIAINEQGFNDGAYSKADSREIRFTEKDKVLYATALGWPQDGVIRIKSLAEGSALYAGKISSVELLGFGKMKYRRTENGLEVYVPAADGATPEHQLLPVLKIR